MIQDMKYIAGRNYNEPKVMMLMNELHPGKNYDVPDPWYGPEAGYHQVYKLIDEACDAIIKKYSYSNIQQSIHK